MFVVKEKKKNQLYLIFILLWAYPSFDTKTKLMFQNLDENLGV